VKEALMTARSRREYSLVDRHLPRGENLSLPPRREHRADDAPKPRPVGNEVEREQADRQHLKQHAHQERTNRRDVRGETGHARLRPGDLLEEPLAGELDIEPPLRVDARFCQETGEPLDELLHLVDHERNHQRDHHHDEEGEREQQNSGGGPAPPPPPDQPVDAGFQGEREEQRGNEPHDEVPQPAKDGERGVGREYRHDDLQQKLGDPCRHPARRGDHGGTSDLLGAARLRFGDRWLGLLRRLVRRVHVGRVSAVRGARQQRFRDAVPSRLVETVR
jgi:hypothetical protein